MTWQIKPTIRCFNKEKIFEYYYGTYKVQMRLVAGRARGVKNVGEKNTDPKSGMKFSPDMKDFQFSILY